MVELTLTLKMTTAQVVGTSVIVNDNSPIQDYVHPEDHTEPTYNLYFVCECLDRSHLNIMVHNQFKFKNKCARVWHPICFKIRFVNCIITLYIFFVYCFAKGFCLTFGI